MVSRLKPRDFGRLFPNTIAIDSGKSELGQNQEWPVKVISFQKSRQLCQFNFGYHSLGTLATHFDWSREGANISAADALQKLGVVPANYLQSTSDVDEDEQPVLGSLSEEEVRTLCKEALQARRIKEVCSSPLEQTMGSTWKRYAD